MSRYTVFSVGKDGNQRNEAHVDDAGWALRFSQYLRAQLVNVRCVVGIWDNEDGTEVSDKLEQGL